MGARRLTIAGALFLGVCTWAPQVHAESNDTVATATPSSSPLLGPATQHAIDLELRRADASLTRSPAPARQAGATVPERKRGVGRIILGAATGAVAGFFGGAYLGASLEPDCHCDDPGLRGVFIGAPIGAVAGGIMGGKWFF